MIVVFQFQIILCPLTSRVTSRRSVESVDLWKKDYSGKRAFFIVCDVKGISEKLILIYVFHLGVYVFNIYLLGFLTSAGISPNKEKKMNWNKTTQHNIHIVTGTEKYKTI